MSRREIVKVLTDYDTSGHGKVVLPKSSIEEHFISQMNEGLLTKVKGAGLDVILTHEQRNEVPLTVSFKLSNQGYVFTKWYKVVKAWGLKTGDEVKFFLKGAPAEPLSVGFEVVTKKFR